MNRISKGSWILVLFSEPGLYLWRLLPRTLYAGIASAIVWALVSWTGMGETVSPAVHSAAGVMLGLLLVFRTNTAYERWWEARGVLADIYATLAYFSAVGASRHELESAARELRLFVTSEGDAARDAKDRFLRVATRMAAWAKASGNDRMGRDLFGALMSAERIKGTPIPASYALHIKVSVFAYILSLPLGALNGAGVWTVPLMALLFFIMGGIEIISNEIEDPFHGDPNDLPVADLEAEATRVVRLLSTQA